jgi:hypothetical protein
MKLKIKRIPVLIIIAAVILLALVVGFILSHPAKKNVSVIPSSNPLAASSPAGSNKVPASDNSQTSGTQGTDSASAQSSPPTAELLAPSGTFVSNHHPSLSGSTSPSSELSTCTTTPGASCYLQFTSGNDVKTLPAQKTDISGSTSWSWDVKTAGFHTGVWKLVAIATLDNQSKSTPDGFTFEVQP